MSIVRAGAGNNDAINAPGVNQMDVGVGLGDVFHRLDQEVKPIFADGFSQSQDETGQEWVGNDVF